MWCDSFPKTMKKLTLSFSNTFKHLLNISRCTSSSEAFPMNKADHIKVILRNPAFSLMKRVAQSINAIISAVFNS